MYYIPDDKIEELKNKLVELRGLYSKFIKSDTFSKLDQEWVELIILSKQQLDDACDIMNINGSKSYFTALDVTLNAYRRLVKCLMLNDCWGDE